MSNNGEVVLFDVEVYRIEYGYIEVSGKAENQTGREVSSVNISVKLYDEGDVRVASGATNEFNIPDGEVFEWTIFPVYDGGYDYYELSVSHRW